MQRLPEEQTMTSCNTEPRSPVASFGVPCKRWNWLPSQVHVRALRRAFVALIVGAASVVWADAQIVLNVQPGATPNQVVLSWSGGAAPYNVYMGGSADLSGGVDVLLAGTSNTSLTTTASGNLVFFRVGDSSAPTVTITSPS